MWEPTWVASRDIRDDDPRSRVIRARLRAEGQRVTLDGTTPVLRARRQSVPTIPVVLGPAGESLEAGEISAYVVITRSRSGALEAP